MKKFPDHPENYNPVQLLHQLTPGILFREKIVTSKNPSVFEVSCEIENIKFSGQGKVSILLNVNSHICIYIY